MKDGTYIVAELTGEARERVAALHRVYDPKLAKTTVPHVTLAGSSGVGPMPARTSAEEIARQLEPIAATTAPIMVRFGNPTRFMQTDIIVLPLDPHGPLRTLHERIARSGLPFERARFPFAPHCTLSFFPTLTAERTRDLMAVRLTDPVMIDRLQCYRTLDAMPAKKILEVVLGGAGPSGASY